MGRRAIAALAAAAAAMVTLAGFWAPAEAARSTGPPAAPVAAAAARAAAAPAEDQIDTSIWPIFNTANNGCIVARGTAESPVVKAACSLDDAEQYWGLEWTGVEDFYRVKNRASGRCLLVRGSVAETPAVQTGCADYADQHWQILQDAAGQKFQLRNRNSGQCLVMRTSQSNARQVGCGTQFVDQWWKRGMPSVSQWSPYLRKPVYLVHGYTEDGNGYEVNNGYWREMISSLRDCSAASNRGVLCLGGPIARSWTYCYYSANTGCDLLAPGDRQKPIKDVGADLAWEIYDHFSRWNVSVDAVGHSMGGLVLEAALTGVAKGDPDFPPYLYVEDVVTIATPHDGIPLAILCQFQQCVDMRGNSAFRQWVQDAPQSAIGTSWSFIGSDDDYTVPADRAVPDRIADALHKAVFRQGQIGEIDPIPTAHMEILEHVSETQRYVVDYCDYWYDCDMGDRSTFDRISTVSPGRMTKEFLAGEDSD